MARKEEEASAISLFSFQDIITSITGIMFLVVLLLVMIMLTSHEPTAREATTETEDAKEMLTQLATLREQLEKLKNIDREIQQELTQLRKLSPAELEAKIKELEKELRRRTEEIKKAQRDLKADQDKLDKINRKIQDLNKKLAPKLKRIKDLEAMRRNLQQQIRNRRNAIAQRKKMMEFSIDNTTNKIPVLVEIDKNGCQVLNIVNNQHHDFRVNGNVPASLEKLWDYLNRSCNPSENYVTLIVKPSGFRYVANITELLKQKKFERGIEILPNEETSIFEVK